MTNKIRVGISALTITLASFCAQAGLVYDSGTPSASPYYVSDASHYSSQAATETSIGAAIATNEITWRGAFGKLNPSKSDFTLHVFSNNGTTLGSLLDTVDMGTAGPAFVNCWRRRCA